MRPPSNLVSQHTTSARASTPEVQRFVHRLARVFVHSIFPRLVSIKDGPIDWGVGVVVKFDKRFTDRVAIKFGISSR